jgi:hypothetical protein
LLDRQIALTIKYWIWQRNEIRLKNELVFPNDDIISEIIKHVHQYDGYILSVALVCKRFYKLIEHIPYRLFYGTTYCNKCEIHHPKRTIHSKCITCENIPSIIHICITKLTGYSEIAEMIDNDLFDPEDVAKLSFVNKFFHEKCKNIIFKKCKYSICYSCSKRTGVFTHSVEKIHYLCNKCKKREVNKLKAQDKTNAMCCSHISKKLII